MKIIEYRCKSYKAFREETRIQIKPLTLLFGKNNSGKSTLLRLPRLILYALSARGRNGFPVKVDELTFGGRFVDLIHGGLTHGSVSLGIVIDDEGERLDLNTTVQNVQNMPPEAGQPKEFCVISHLCIAQPVINLEWEPRSKMVATYKGIGELPFRGLLPDIHRNDPAASDWSFVKDWRERAQFLEEQISHLGPVRDEVPRVLEGGVAPPLGFGGFGAVARLGQNGNLFDRVSSWFQENMDGWRISLDYASSAYKCLFQRGDISVNLADAGYGIQQVLPVVVQQLSHLAGDNTSVIDLVEQPELHLHAAAHAPLADLFLETAKQGNCQVIVETHSENILLRVRRRIAEGLDPSMVVLYYVLEHPDGYSSVRPIAIEPDGNVDWWPEGVFSEGYEELKAINKAQRLRLRNKKS